MVEYKQFRFTQDGKMEYQRVNDNFVDIGADVTRLEEEIEAVKKTSGLINLSVLCESEGQVVILPDRIHPNVSLVSGYIVAADNVKETVNVKVLYGNKETEIANGVMKATEKSGKGHNLTIKTQNSISRMDEVIVYTDNRRKVIVNLTFEVKE